MCAGVALCALMLLQPSTVAAQEDATEGIDQASMLEMIQQLTAQVEALQAQLAEQRSEMQREMQEFREEISSQLREGMQNEEVRKLQELLATDPDIYPEQLVTGYYGQLTRQALRRLQDRHDLEVTGEVDDETRELINQYLAERMGDDIPPGLLRAPGIVEAVKRGVCNRGRGNRPFCPTSSDDEDDDDDDDEDNFPFDDEDEDPLGDLDDEDDADDNRPF